MLNETQPNNTKRDTQHNETQLNIRKRDTHHK
jgi:hypothetical protein